MREIPLTKGKVALVDDEDFDFLSQWKWYAVLSYNSWHAWRTVKRKGIKFNLPMHHAIIPPPDGCEIDHKNRDGLDNRRENLRVCTKRQNGQNRVQVCRRSKSSRFHGVTYSKKYRLWRPVICAGSLNSKGYARQLYLGRFKSEEEAAKVYDRAALKHFGEFAVTNFPREEYANEDI